MPANETLDKHKILLHVSDKHSPEEVKAWLRDLLGTDLRVTTEAYVLDVDDAEHIVVNALEELSGEINKRTDLKSYVWHSGGGIQVVRIDDKPARWLFTPSEYGEEWDIGIYHEDTTEALAFFADMRVDQILALLNAIPSRPRL